MKPVIFGLEGERLSDAERALLQDVRPCGIILFKRNISTPQQVVDLVASARAAICRVDGVADILVMIDQEGGRVQRLGPPHWRRIPPAGDFALMAEREDDKACQALRLSTIRLGAELRQLGINCNCAPVLDIPTPDAHDIISDRAYGDDAADVIRLGRVVLDGLMNSGILPVIKHIPGHGRANADSHSELPVVDTPIEELRETDFKPFRELRDAPLAMTAHVLFSAIDEDNPVTHSQKIIADSIRGEIDFQGLLVSDDLAMGALKGAPAERVERALAAGVDIALHCNGKLAEMLAIAEILPEMPDSNQNKLQAALDSIAKVPEVDIADITQRYDDLMADEE